MINNGVETLVCKQVIHIKGTLAVEHTNHLRLSCFSTFKLRFYHFVTFNKKNSIHILN